MYFSSFYVKIDCIFVLVNQLKKITMKTIVEINNDKGAFCFKTFETKTQAENFCKQLTLNCKTLKATIKN